MQVVVQSFVSASERTLPWVLESLSNDDARKQRFDMLNEENNRGAHVARTLVQVFDVICQMTV